jgi:hypothetical protein
MFRVIPFRRRRPPPFRTGIRPTLDFPITPSTKPLPTPTLASPTTTRLLAALRSSDALASTHRQVCEDLLSLLLFLFWKLMFVSCTILSGSHPPLILRRVTHTLPLLVACCDFGSVVSSSVRERSALFTSTYICPLLSTLMVTRNSGREWLGLFGCFAHLCFTNYSQSAEAKQSKTCRRLLS